MLGSVGYHVGGPLPAMKERKQAPWIDDFGSAVDQAIMADEERLRKTGWTRHEKYWRHNNYPGFTYSRDAAVHQLVIEGEG